MSRKIMAFGCICFLSCLMLAGNAEAQSGTAAAKIEAVYGSYASRLSAEQQQWLHDQLERTAVRKAAEVTVPVQPLLSSLPLVTKYVPSPQPDDFSKPLSVNPLKYAIDFFNPADQAFRIDGTGYVLFVKGYVAPHK